MATEIPSVKEVQAALITNVEPDAWKGGKGPNAGGVLSRVRSAMAEGRTLDSALIAEVFAAFNAYKQGEPTRLAKARVDVVKRIERHSSGLREAQKELAEIDAKLAKLSPQNA